MSTEDATYVIAHIEGIDISKYLEPNTPHVWEFLFPINTRANSIGSFEKE